MRVKAGALNEVAEGKVQEHPAAGREGRQTWQME